MAGQERTRKTVSVVGVAWIVLVSGLAGVSLTPPRARAATYLAEDFEAGAGSWTTTGWWHWVSAADPCPLVAYSGTATMGYHIDTAPPATPGNACTYDEDQSPGAGIPVRNAGNLTSPPVDLTTATTARLTFFSWLEDEAVPGFEDINVLVSPDGGSSWALLGPVNDPQYPQATWNRVEMDLGPWAGSTVLIRFSFDTRDDVVNNRRGWFVDDIRVDDDFQLANTTFFAEDVDTGGFGWAAGGLWHVSTFGFDPCAIAPRSLFNTWGYHIDPFCDYDAGGGGPDRLVSPPINLVSASEARLTAWSHYGLDGGDFAVVEVDAGAGFVPVLSLVAAGIPMNRWQLLEIDLTPFAGNMVRLSFAVTRDASPNSAEGWYLDDIAVTGRRITLNAAWQPVPPNPDGAYPFNEHIQGPGNTMELLGIPGNGFGTTLIVENDADYLYVTYDAWGDMTADPVGDQAVFALDTDRDFAPTDAADDEFLVSSAGVREHRTYDSVGGTWAVEDACDPTFAGDHTGLACAVGYGPSPTNPGDHRIYEFRIPLVLVDVPLPVTAGYLLGALGGGTGGPGVWDNAGAWDTWPAFFGAPPSMIAYGDIVLAGSPGPCGSLMPLSDNTPLTCPRPLPDFFSFPVGPLDTDHAVVAMRPPPTADYDLLVFDSPAFSTQIASSNSGAGAVDYVVLHDSWAPLTLGAEVIPSFNPGDYQIEMENDVPDQPVPGTWFGAIAATAGGIEVVDAFEIGPLVAATTYEVFLDAPPTADVDLFVHDFTFGTVESRNVVTFFSANPGAGVDEMLTFTAVSPANLLLLVTSADSGTGTYSVTVSAGLCVGLGSLANNAPATCDTPMPPDHFYYNSGGDAVVGMRPPFSGDYDLSVYADSTFASWIEGSTAVGPPVDFIALDRNVWSSPPNRGVAVNALSGNGDYQVEVDTAATANPIVSSWGGSMDATPGGIEVLDAWRVDSATPGLSYTIDLTVPATADLSLFLLEYAGDSARARSEAQWFSAAAGFDVDESVTFTATGALEYILVVLNEDPSGAGAGTGPYQIAGRVAGLAPSLTFTGEPNYAGNGVYPFSGNLTTPFTYRVLYADADDEPPAAGDPLVHILQGGVDIPGSPFAMAEDDPLDTTYTDGKIYTFTTSLPARALDYTYYFTTSDASGAPAPQWPDPPLDDPDVFNIHPIIDYTGEAGFTGDGVEPDLGTTLDSYTFRVLYRDPDNDAPTITYVYIENPPGTDIPGSPFSLTLSSWIGAPGDYAAGAIYETVISLPTSATYTHSFWAEDGVYDALGPARSPVSLPVVQDPLLVAATVIAPAIVTAGQADVGMLRLEFDAVTAPVSVDGLYVQLSGIPPDPLDVFEVRAWADDGDGLFDPLVDTPLDAATAWSGTPPEVSLNLNPDPVVTPSVTTLLFVSFTIDPVAVGGHWVGARLDSVSSVVPVGGLVIPAGFPFDSYQSGVRTQIALAPGPPVLGYTGDPGYTADGVNPDSGPRGPFTFRVLYQDGDNAPPAFVNLVLERGGAPVPGSPFAAAFDSWVGGVNDFVAGARYQVTVPLTVLGTDYSYHFEANDTQFDATGPATNTHTGPAVVNSLPTLSAGGVLPVTGATGSTFTWAVTFADADNDLPAAGSPTVRVRQGGIDVPGGPFAMAQVNPLDTDTTDGKNYTFSLALTPCGTNYDFLFLGDDGLGGSSLPLGPMAGPDVTGCTGAAPVLDWTGETGYAADGLDPETGTTLTPFSYRIAYSDADNDTPLAGYPRVHVFDNGTSLAGSPFAMAFAAWVGAADDYVAGAIYTYSTSLAAGTLYTYFFDASDSSGNTAAFPVAPIDAPDVTPVPNQAPTADAGPDRSASRNDAVTLDGTGSTDPDLDTLTFQWTVLTGPGAPTLTGATSATASFASGSVGVYMIELRVDDGNGANDTDTVVVTIGNGAPTIVAATPTAGALTATVNQAVGFSVTATDPDLDPLTYSWTVDGNVSGSGSGANFTFTPTVAATYTVTVTVRDGLETANRSWTVIVTAEPGVQPLNVGLLLLLLIVIVVVVLVLLWLFLRRRKKAEAPIDAAAGGAQPTPESPQEVTMLPEAEAPGTPPGPAVAQAPPAGTPATPPAEDPITTRLERLKKLKEQGLLTEEEYQRALKETLEKI